MAQYSLFVLKVSLNTNQPTTSVYGRSPVFMTTFVIVFISYTCCHEASRLDGQWLSDHTINFVRWQTGSTLQWSMGEACCA